MQGPLFGFLDEMTGAVQGIKSAATGGEFRASLSRGPDLIRGMEEQYRKDYPITATVAPLMASTPVFVGGPRSFSSRALPAQATSCATWRALRQLRPDTGLSLLLASLRAAGAIF